MGLMQQDEPRCRDGAADCGQTVPRLPELGDQYAIMAERGEPVAIIRTEERRYRMSDEGRGGLRVARPKLASSSGTGKSSLQITCPCEAATCMAVTLNPTLVPKALCFASCSATWKGDDDIVMVVCSSLLPGVEIVPYCALWRTSREK